ncbi:unnamed protein product [Clavelina lepadiformis]|uniref:Uncharacterized protein n=1 Tax=Clavelina lepadiformis TaxID=159417 RepID=A0ABP0F025_CLALP
MENRWEIRHANAAQNEISIGGIVNLTFFGAQSVNFLKGFLVRTREITQRRENFQESDLNPTLVLYTKILTNERVPN